MPLRLGRINLGLRALTGAFLCFCTTLPLHAGSQDPFSSQPPSGLKTLSLEELGNLKVTTQSKEPTEIWQTPSAVYVLTHAG